jgi:hypothetical protein
MFIWWPCSSFYTIEQFCSSGRLRISIIHIHLNQWHSFANWTHQPPAAELVSCWSWPRCQIRQGRERTGCSRNSAITNDSRLWKVPNFALLWVQNEQNRSRIIDFKGVLLHYFWNTLYVGGEGRKTHLDFAPVQSAILIYIETEGWAVNQLFLQFKSIETALSRVFEIVCVYSVIINTNSMKLLCCRTKSN